MAFKMKHAGSSFPFFGRDRKGETWVEGTSGKQKRIERRLDKLKLKGKTDSGKYRRNIARLESMKKGEMGQKYVHQPTESVDTYEEFYDE